MSDELPAGEKAVYVFLEMVAFCFLLACVDALVGKKPWLIWLGCLVLAVAFFLAGIKWPKIRKMLPNRAGSRNQSRAEFTSVARTIPNEPSRLVESEGRTVVNVTPEYLLGLFEDHVSLQAEKLASVYIGKWIEISGPLGDVFPRRGGKDSYTSSVVFGDRGVASNKAYVFMQFHDTWIDRLEVLRRGSTIKILGQITEISRAQVELDNCEIVDHPPEKLN
jgi:hypothetical protein